MENTPPPLPFIVRARAYKTESILTLASFSLFINFGMNLLNPCMSRMVLEMQIYTFLHFELIIRGSILRIILNCIWGCVGYICSYHLLTTIVRLARKYG